MKRLLILVFLVGASYVIADEPKHANAAKAVASHVETLPVPPQQQVAWALPATIKDPDGAIHKITINCSKPACQTRAGCPIIM